MSSHSIRPVLVGPDLEASLKDIAARKLWLVDISNYVPGDPDECDGTHISGVCEYHLPRKARDMLKLYVGEKFVGMDNGEQDGRYISYSYPVGGGSQATRAAELRHGYVAMLR